MRKLTFAILGVVILATASAADTKLKLESLPPAVQATVREQTKHATLVGLSKEVEKGKTMYEVETKVNGKARDLMLDATGKITSVEEEVDITAIPVGARQAIEKKATGGAVKRVEILTLGATVAYEAAIQIKGRNSEFTVNADGSVHK
ncbi:MAG: hypothetical protein ABI811_16805 [Acidobacteriota bacterium]